MSKVTNITLAGVGGQGIILTSEILARAAALAGYDVKKSEIHGMSQRGGSVSSQVRFGESVASPIIADGDTDILVAFERTEAARNYPVLKKGGKALINNLDIVPLTVSSGMQPGIDDIAALLDTLYGASALHIDSARIAETIGNPRTANIAIAGALSTFLPFPEEAWIEALSGKIKHALVEINLRAFKAGRESIS
jgi:Pyruvate:ferredoxin oxidoreductase and related 2-oxoacid:ferredoxin oxidoreductases, gamma subunit